MGPVENLLNVWQFHIQFWNSNSLILVVTVSLPPFYSFGCIIYLFIYLFKLSLAWLYYGIYYKRDRNNRSVFASLCVCFFLKIFKIPRLGCSVFYGFLWHTAGDESHEIIHQIAHPLLKCLTFFFWFYSFCEFFPITITYTSTILFWHVTSL